MHCSAWENPLDERARLDKCNLHIRTPLNFSYYTLVDARLVDSRYNYYRLDAQSAPGAEQSSEERNERTRNSRSAFVTIAGRLHGNLGMSETKAHKRINGGR